MKPHIKWGPTTYVDQDGEVFTGKKELEQYHHKTLRSEKITSEHNGVITILTLKHIINYGKKPKQGFLFE